MKLPYEQLVLDADGTMWCSPFAQETDEPILVNPDVPGDTDCFRVGHRRRAEGLTPAPRRSPIAKPSTHCSCGFATTVTIVAGDHAGETGWIGYRPPDVPAGLMPVVLSEGITMPSRVAWVRLSQVRLRVRVDGVEVFGTDHVSPLPPPPEPEAPPPPPLNPGQRIVKALLATPEASPRALTQQNGVSGTDLLRARTVVDDGTFVDGVLAGDLTLPRRSRCDSATRRARDRGLNVVNEELEVQQIDELDALADDPELQLIDPELQLTDRLDDDEPPELEIDGLDEPGVDDLIVELNAIKQVDFEKFTPEQRADVIEVCKRAAARKAVLRDEAEGDASEALATFTASLAGREVFGYRFTGEPAEHDVADAEPVIENVIDDDDDFAAGCDWGDYDDDEIDETPALGHDRRLVEHQSTPRRRSRR